MSLARSLCLGTLAGFAVYSNALAETLDSAIQNATTSGMFRFGYIAFDPDVAGSTDTSAAAVGGHLKFETAEWQRLQFAIAPYFVEKIEALSGDEDKGELNGDFFDQNGDSYAYLGEAYVNYRWSQGTLRVGRQKLDKPFINTDDIRMLPNSFDAIWATMVMTDSLALEAGHVNRWAGFDSGVSQEKFKNVGDDGVNAIGATWQMNERHTLSGWYYDFDGFYSQVYLDGSYSRGKFEAAVQYTDYSEENASTIDGNAWGVMAGYDLDVVKLAVAINEASSDDGKSVSLGLGGGNFFTSMAESTIAGMTDASAWMISAAFPVNEALGLSAAYGHFEDGTVLTNDQDELNLYVDYQINKNTDVSFIWSSVENDAAPADDGSNFTRQLLRVNYQF